MKELRANVSQAPRKYIMSILEDIKKGKIIKFDLDNTLFQQRD